MKTIRRFLQPLSLLALVAGLAAATALAQSTPAARLDSRLSTAGKDLNTLDRIVAVVNDEVITQIELAERNRVVVGQLQRAGGQLPAPEVLRNQILERMINDKVQVQLAKETGVKIDEATVEKTVQRIAEDNNLSMTAFRQALERDGVQYARFREDMRNELVLARLREREVENAIVVTDAEAESELARAARERGGDTEYRLQHILVMLPQQATPDQIEARRRRAMQALSQLRQGASFTEISATYSDAPDALQGGNLGWRAAGRLPTLFLDALDKIPPGETSDILRSPNGFHIVKLLEKRDKEKTPQIAQTQARHILLRTKDGISDADARNRLAKLRERIVAGEDFAELARVHSEDGTAARGGDLGWISPGETVPEFERALSGLRDGEISQPIQTPFGWHIVQAIERRNEEVSPERAKLLARQTVRSRKADEAYQDWLRQIRDRAYVEIRLDEQ